MRFQEKRKKEDKEKSLIAFYQSSKMDLPDAPKVISRYLDKETKEPIEENPKTLVYKECDRIMKKEKITEIELLRDKVS